MWFAKAILLCSLTLVVNIHAWKIFHRGRGAGGNLGLPVRSSISSVKQIPEKWFIQNLDHFNPVDQRTWKQVYQLHIHNTF